MAGDSGRTDVDQIPKSKPNSWFQFKVGFTIVFIMMALAWPMFFFDGRTVLRTSLWHYYLLELRSAFAFRGGLGPMSGGIWASLIVFGMHLLISAVAGFAGVALGWAFRRRPRST